MKMMEEGRTNPMGLPLADLIFMTWRSLSSQWLRSGLTTFGVFMGVGAVSATLNIQTITHRQIELKLAERDRPFVIPYVYANEGPKPQLDEALQKALKDSIPEIQSISALTSIYLGSTLFEGQESEADVSSVSLNYLDTTGRKVLQGRFFDLVDQSEYRPVALVDEQLAEILFQGQSPLGQAIYVGGNRFVIIGLIEAKSNSEWESEGGELWITETFATVLSGGSLWPQLQISAHTLSQIDILTTAVEDFLQQSYPQAEVYIGSNADDLLAELEVQKIVSAALTAVGMVALIIGGVGIANITVAAVLERTKEIGIRRAIGASKLEVMGQFVLEATVLSLVGGTAAVGAVHGLTQLATTLVIEAPYEFSTRNAAMAMGAALSVGVGASFVPALRATQVDIVKSLRSE